MNRLISVAEVIRIIPVMLRELKPESYNTRLPKSIEELFGKRRKNESKVAVCDNKRHKAEFISTRAKMGLYKCTIF